MGKLLCAMAVAVPGTDGVSSTATRGPACCQVPQNIFLRVGKTGCFQGNRRFVPGRRGTPCGEVILGSPEITGVGCQEGRDLSSK